MENHHLTVRPDTEWRPPERQSLRHISMCILPKAIAMTLFKQNICKPSKWPKLATMGMSAENKTGTKRICMSNFCGLMVNHNDRIFIAGCKK